MEKGRVSVRGEGRLEEEENIFFVKNAAGLFYVDRHAADSH